MVNLLISPMLDPSIMTFRTGIRDGFGVFFQSFVDTGYHYNKVLAFIAADHKLYIAHLFWNNGSERCRSVHSLMFSLRLQPLGWRSFILSVNHAGENRFLRRNRIQPFSKLLTRITALSLLRTEKTGKCTAATGRKNKFCFCARQHRGLSTEFLFSREAAQEDTDPEFAKICRKIGQADVEQYPLYETSGEMEPPIPCSAHQRLIPSGIAKGIASGADAQCLHASCTSILCVDFGSLLQKESGHAGDGGAGNTPCVNRLCGNPRMAELQQRLLLPDALWLQRSPHDVCIGGCDIRGGKTVSAKSGRA